MKNASIETSLVTSRWLYKNLKAENLVILDATMNSIKQSDQKFKNEQILGAHAVNLKTQFSDTGATFPSTIPSASKFIYTVSELGIRSDSAVIIYDQKGIYSSPRLWWLFKSFGHDQVAVLGGGFSEWKKNNYPTESNSDLTIKTSNNTKDYKAHMSSNCILKFDQISSLSQNKNFLIVDARSSGRFKGLEPEPRDGLRGGNIPNSINLPYTEVLDNGNLKKLPELRVIFDKFNIANKNLIFTCGSGITACILALAADLLGIKNISVYDGSWTEYGTLTH